MHEADQPPSSKATFGLIEGYYGRLLTWAERQQLLLSLDSTELNSWFYAPKDDPWHRYRWREAYPREWQDSFRQFSRLAEQQGVELIGGIAPGLDFRFSDRNGPSDFQRLFDKAKSLLAAGAHRVCLLMDDIDVEFDGGSDFSHEGQAHAFLANALGDELGQAIDVVPRVYADELEHESPGYLEAMLAELAPRHRLMHCGSDIVARSPDTASPHLALATNERQLVVWDNLWANDYCPRQLYLGPWLGRERCSDVLINPTGLPHTDALLMKFADATRRHQASGRQIHHDASATERQAADAWMKTLQGEGVPAEFLVVAAGLWLPWCNGMAADAFPWQDCLPEQAVDPHASPKQWLDALDTLLWRWKSPLAREWFPWLMGLRQDVLLVSGQLSETRIRKVQPYLLQSMSLEKTRRD